MTKFFRKIRQRLLTENKFSKYLLYAFGEILLVVIGILMALAINEWKNEQRIHSEEKVTLQKLTQDLKSDNQRFLKNIEYYNKRNDYLTDAKEIIYKKSLSDKEIKKVMHYGGAIHKDLNPRKTTYNEMLNSGRIYNLSNENLVDSIIAYYQYLDESIYQNRVSRTEFRALFFGPDFSDFWFWKAEDDEFPYAKMFFSDTDSPSYRKLKQSAGWSISINNGLLQNNEILLQMNKSLIDNLNNELKQKK
tara:strand:+ start:16402 stop:17145 length:744 start_codon:yes stop_codon:yes gene_type:complete